MPTAIEQCCFGVQRCLKHCNVRTCVHVLHNRLAFTMQFTLHVCIGALSDYTHCATSQVVEAALQCLKTNPAASVHALPVLKSALASLLLDSTAIQRSGETSFPMCSFPTACSFPPDCRLCCTTLLLMPLVLCMLQFGCNFGCSFDCSLQVLANISTWLLHNSIELPVTYTLHCMSLHNHLCLTHTCIHTYVRHCSVT